MFKNHLKLNLWNVYELHNRAMKKGSELFIKSFFKIVTGKLNQTTKEGEVITEH